MLNFFETNFHMKIFVIDTINNIPSHKQFQDFSIHLKKCNHDVIHFSTNSAKIDGGVEVVYWNMSFKWKSFLIFLKYFKQKPDVVISTFRGNLFADFFSYLFKFQFYPFFRSDFYNRKWSNVLRYRNAKQLIVLSSPMLPRVEKMYPHLRGKVCVLYNSFNFKSNLSLEKEDFILHVGGLDFNNEGKLIKGTDLLLQAFTNLLKKNLIPSSYKLIVAGDGSGLQDLKCRFSCESIIFKGRVSHQEVLNLMSKSKIFALPSRNDAFPNVLLEAMQHACALIGSYGTGAQDIIEVSDYGYLIESENVTTLEFALLEAVNNYVSSEKCWETYSNKRNCFSRESWINSLYQVISDNEGKYNL